MSFGKNIFVSKNCVDDIVPSSSVAKNSNNLVVRINQDSDDNLQALFDSVLNPGDAKRPLQVPFRMRKLPNSFFHPPAVNVKTVSASHSRANSADSAFDCGSQSNVQASELTQSLVSQSLTTNANDIQSPPVINKKLTINHSRAHSSPASLQQSYSLRSTNIIGDSVNCVPAFDETNRTGFLLNSTGNDAIGHSPCGSQELVNSIQSLHMKQRSFDVVSPIQLQNELGVLPPGWEQAKTNDGQIYYLNHSTKTTQWEDPRMQFKQRQITEALHHQNGNSGEISKESLPLTEELGPLPEGWEQALTESGDVYFINHVDRTTSWNDPRIPDFLQKTFKARKLANNWIREQKPEQSSYIKNNCLNIDPFLSGDNHARQESSDSGLSLSSNTYGIHNDFTTQLDESMDCLSDNGINALGALECADNLVSSLQLEDNICSEIFSDVQDMLNVSSSKPDSLEWYKIN